MRTRRCTAFALGVVLTFLAASCSMPKAPEAKPPSGGSGASGGSLHVLSQGPVRAWDPQRQQVGADMAFAGRIFQRTLTAWAPPTSAQTLPILAPDLATDTGTVASGGRVWSFTLRGDVTWQDGKPVTCADVKYGISRTFATTQITGGPTYALAFLDVPRNADGSSTYAGPYLKTGQGGFDRAVTCSRQTVTFRLVTPVPDFNQVVALAAFSPVRKERDRGAGSATEIFSNGPYLLKGAWQSGKGATFVRNPHWDSTTDSIRKARPAEVIYQEGIPVGTVVSRIMTGESPGSRAVTAESTPQALWSKVMADPAIRTRSSNPRAPFVDYLLPNFNRPIMTRLPVRQALAVSTNREAYVAALGGGVAAEATHAMISKSLPAYRDFNPLNVPPSGDAARARALLRAAGLALPVRITVAYRKGSTSDRAMASLRKGWQEAGFSVTLMGIEKDYFRNIALVRNSRGYDVMWAVGSAAWPSGASVIPSLFDSRVNLTSSSSGQDYGRFASAAFSAKIDAVARIPGTANRERAWGDLDLELATSVAAIALTNSKSLLVHGSAVTGYIDSQALFGTVDLATVSVR